jgi:hypothetical protein
MREIIKNQLLKCTYANLNNFNPETNTFYIPKYSKPQYVVGKMYLVQLPLELLNNSSVIATNWNNGSAPKFQYLKVYVSKLLGKMVYVDSIGKILTKPVKNHGTADVHAGVTPLCCAYTTNCTI